MGVPARLIAKLLLQTAMASLVYAALLFGAAGSFDWPSAWAYLAVFTSANLAAGIWLARVDPDLLEERLKPPIQTGQKVWDRFFFLAVGAVFLVWVVLQGLDARRFGWSHCALWAQVLGALMTVLSFIGIGWVYRTNSFAAAVIKMQPERRQVVVSKGPYAYIRHPMYAFGFFILVGMPLALGSLWGLAGLPVLAGLFHLRTLGEEQMLRRELNGYEDYARRVPWRYAPGLW